MHRIHSECCICLDPMNDNEPLVKLQCNHQLHTRCFLGLISQNPESVDCPLCRSRILVLPPPPVPPLLPLTPPPPSRQMHTIIIAADAIDALVAEEERHRLPGLTIGLSACALFSFWLLYLASAHLYR